MPVSDTAVRLPLTALTRIPLHVRKLIVFGIIIFAVYSGDGIMSYMAPVLIEERFGNPLLMGLIMSTSSVFGFCFDFLAGKFFKNATYAQFTKWLLLFAICFPLILLLLPHEAPFLIAAMAVWGLYYELTKFSQFTFVKKNMQPSQHTMSWSVFEVLHAAGFVIGPIIASILIDQDSALPLAAASLFFFLAVVLFKLLLVLTHSARHTIGTDAKQQPAHEASTVHVWELLGNRLWPLLLFTFALVLIDTAFMSVGTLLAEELKESSALGLFLIPAYSAPFLLMPWFAPLFSRPFGKKRTAFIAGILGGALLVAGSLAQSIEVVLALVFVASLCFALSYPEMNATFEDYVVRVGKFGNTLVGLQSSMYSLAYIVGPIVAGFIATQWGNMHTLTVFGGLLSVVGVLALVVTPRKVLMPQGKLMATL